MDFNKNLDVVVKDNEVLLMVKTSDNKFDVLSLNTESMNTLISLYNKKLKRIELNKGD